MIGVPATKVAVAVRTGRLDKSIAYEEGSGRAYVSNVELARQEWESNVPSGKGTKGEVKGLTQGTYTEAQRVNLLERTRKVKLERKIKAGMYVEREQVKKDAFEANRIMRDTLLNIPDRVSGELAAVTSIEKVHEILDREIRIALDAYVQRVENLY
jgi:hypothetical protein